MAEVQCMELAVVDAAVFQTLVLQAHFEPVAQVGLAILTSPVEEPPEARQRALVEAQARMPALAPCVAQAAAVAVQILELATVAMAAMAGFLVAAQAAAVLRLVEQAGRAAQGPAVNVS